MRAAMDLILAVIASDPQSSSCPNLSYADVRGPVSSVYPTGSPYAFPLITTSPSNLLLRPDATSLAAVNPYLLGPLAAPLNPMDAAVLLQLVNNGGDQLSALQQQQVQAQQQAQQVQQAQQNAALNTFLQMGGGAGNLTPATGAIVTPNHQQPQSQQASSSSPLATAAVSLGSFCSNPAFLPGGF